MTDVLTVPTHFGDISELSTGLADRVDEERLILYGPTAYEEGATVGFAVLLVDGSPALEGVGRVTAAVDGGEERAPETRFDIVFDSLQLEGMSEVVYERIVMARMSMVGEEPATGEIDMSELEAAESTAAEPQEAVEEPADWEGDEATAVADPEQMAALADLASGEAELDYEDAGETAVADASDFDGADVAAAESEVAAEADVADVDMADAALDEVVADVAADAADVDFAVDEGDVADVDIEAGAADVDDLMAEVADVADEGDVAVDVGGDSGDGFESMEGRASSPSSPGGYTDSLGPPPEDPPIAPSPELPPAPLGFQIQPSGGQLVRPTFPPTWHPMAEPAAEPTESTGFFLYQANDLPVPELAPRPDMDPSLRVRPAPSPDASAADVVHEMSPDLEGDVGEEPPQVPLPDEDSDVAPAVEPDSFALGDEVEIQDEGAEGEAFEAAPELEYEGAYDEAIIEGDDVAEMQSVDDDDFEGEISIEGGDELAFEEDAP